MKGKIEGEKLKIALVSYYNMVNILPNLKLGLESLGHEVDFFYFEDGANKYGEVGLKRDCDITDELSGYDVVHLDNNSQYTLPYITGFNELDCVKVAYYHGTEVRSGRINMGMDISFVSGPDLLQYGAEGTYTWLPLPVKPPTDFTKEMDGVCNIGHFPMNRTDIKEYSSRIFRHDLYPEFDDTVKGHRLFDEITSRWFEKENVRKFDDHVTYAEVESAMKECSILFDQVYLGSYGSTAIDAMSMGIPVLGRISNQVALSYAKEFGMIPPVFDVNYNTSNFIIGLLKGYPKLREEIGKVSKNFVSAVHDRNKIAERYIKAINEVKE